MAPLTKKSSEASKYIQNLLAGDASVRAFGVQDVFYGDQVKLQRTPAIAVHPGTMARRLYEASLRTENTFPIFILCYYGKIQDIQTNELASDQLAETVVDVLHANFQLGGLIVNGHASLIDPGVAVRSGAMLRTTRITFDCMSITTL